MFDKKHKSNRRTFTKTIRPNELNELNTTFLSYRYSTGQPPIWGKGKCILVLPIAVICLVHWGWVNFIDIWHPTEKNKLYIQYTVYT